MRGIFSIGIWRIMNNKFKSAGNWLRRWKCLYMWLWIIYPVRSTEFCRNIYKLLSSWQFFEKKVPNERGMKSGFLREKFRHLWGRSGFLFLEIQVFYGRKYRYLFPFISFPRLFRSFSAISHSYSGEFPGHFSFLFMSFPGILIQESFPGILIQKSPRDTYSVEFPGILIQ